MSQEPASTPVDPSAPGPAAKGAAGTPDADPGAEAPRLTRSGPALKEADPGKDGSGAGGTDRPGADRDYTEYAQAGVTHVYVVDQRNYGVYAGPGGTVRAKKVTGHDGRGDGAGGRLSEADERHISAVLVSESVLLSLEHVRVSSPGDEKLGDLLTSRRLAILHGPEGHGKGSAALAALGLHESILNLDPSVTPADLSDFARRRPLEGSSRYVVESLSPDTAQRLNSFVLRSLERDLAANDGRLVITVDARATLDPDITAYVLPWTAKPDPALLLRRHLGLHVGAEQVDEIFADEASASVVEALGGRSLREAAETARRLAELLAGGRPLTEAVQSAGLDATARVREWFAKDPSIEDIAFVIATAVLGGCRYATVAAAAQPLAKLIARGSRHKLSRVPVNPLRTRSERVEQAMAVLEPAVFRTSYGLASVETIRLENRWLVQALLDEVHHEYDVLRAATYTWLEDLGRSDDADVRLRAAGAVAWLAQHDFPLADRQILLPWALGTTRESRAAAEVLGVAAWLEPCAALALELVHTWAQQRSDLDLWWTAAAAYGGELGVRFPSVAMDGLYGIVTADHGDVDATVTALRIVSEGALRLLRGGGRYDPGLADLVLQHLASWLDADRAAAYTARRCYTSALFDASDVEWAWSADNRRLLLHDSTRSASARLLRAVLTDGKFRDDALDSLEALLRACDLDDSFFDPLAALVVTATTGEGTNARDLLRIRHYLNRWCSGRRPSTSARTLLDRLPEPENA